MSTLSILKNVTGTAGDFSMRYTQLRLQEARLYTDEQVATLPFIDIAHPHHKEWMVRKRSAMSLLNYIEEHCAAPRILEVGCGNGWLSRQLSSIPGSHVTGIDINSPEIMQAARVFGEIENLEFTEAGLDDPILADQKFDFIIFAATIQYFSSLKNILRSALEHTTLLGEIIITDSRFYSKKELAAARQRSADYFSSIGMSDMAGYYFHHTLDQLNGFQYRIMAEPGSWKNKLALIRDPFHRIIIKNPYR